MKYQPLKEATKQQVRIELFHLARFHAINLIIPLQEGHASSSTDPSPPALGAAVVLEEAGCCRCPQDTLLPLKGMFSAQIQPGIYCSAWEEVAGGSPSCANSFLATGDVSNTPFPLGMWFAWHNETLSVYQGGRR